MYITNLFKAKTSDCVVRILFLICFFILILFVLHFHCYNKRKGVENKQKQRGGPTGRKETNRFNMAFVEISPGNFCMGSDSDQADSNERPIHNVILTKPFKIQMTEVTQSQWESVMGSNPSYFKGGNLPVESVSWNDCQLFIQKLNVLEPNEGYRLPTEAEWEYACRSGSVEDRYGYFAEIAWCGMTTIHPVGKKFPNAWGLFDMLGNVWEWCSDKYGYYTIFLSINPTGSFSGTYRVIRGGCWAAEADCSRASSRRAVSPDTKEYFIGLRLAKDSKNK